MEDNLKYKYYLEELGETFKEMALDAKKHYYSIPDSDSETKNHYCGYLCGMHRIVSLMQQLTIGFDIDLKDLHMDDIDADRDLV